MEADICSLPETARRGNLRVQGRSRGPLLGPVPDRGRPLGDRRGYSSSTSSGTSDGRDATGVRKMAPSRTATRTPRPPQWTRPTTMTFVARTDGPDATWLGIPSGAVRLDHVARGDLRIRRSLARRPNQHRTLQRHRHDDPAALMTPTSGSNSSAIRHFWKNGARRLGHCPIFDQRQRWPAWKTQPQSRRPIEQAEKSPSAAFRCHPSRWKRSRVPTSPTIQPAMCPSASPIITGWFNFNPRLEPGWDGLGNPYLDRRFCAGDASRRRSLPDDRRGLSRLGQSRPARKTRRGSTPSGQFPKKNSSRHLVSDPIAKQTSRRRARLLDGFRLRQSTVRSG